MSLCAAFAGSLLAAATPVYARIEPLEIRTGVVRLRTVQAPFIEVPDIRAEPHRWSEERFARLYSIEYELQTRRAGEPPVVETRGTFLAAVHMGSEALQALEERVRAHVAALTADDFLGIILDNAAPFDELATTEEGRSWVCTIQPREDFPNRATVYKPGIVDERGSLVSLGFTLGELPDRLCPAMVAAATGAPEEFRTMPVPLAVRETVVEAETSGKLAGEIRADELAPLPQAVQFFKRSGPDGHGFFGPEKDGMVPVAKYTFDGTEWVAITVPASLSTEALAGKAFVSRWTLRQVERRLGTEPQETVRTNAALTLAILPVAPPGVQGQPATAPSGPVAVNFDDAALRKDVLARIESESALDVEKLEGYLTQRYGLWNEGFLLAVCRPDGTAWFGLLPTHSRNRVTNASAVCAAMDRRLR